MKDPYAPVPPGTMGTLEYIDDIGTIHVKWDNGRTLGLAMGEDSFTILPPEPTLLKLFFPLTADLYERDEWGSFSDESTQMDGKALLEYEGAILKALQDNQMQEETERGIMHWYSDEDSVNGKVRSAAFAVETRDGQLWGVAECKVVGSLTPEELTALTDYISGQASDGLGEGFEQKAIRVGTADLYVHLWNSDDWSIMTEAQRFGPDFVHKLPDMCWSVNEVDGSLICIKKGERGHFLSKWSSCDPDTNRRLADHYNQKHGITKAQEQAMSVGSMSGWNVPGVDPQIYEKHQGQGGTSTMGVNAFTEEYESIELFENPALYTLSRVDPASIPDGWHLYEVRGSDDDPGEIYALEHKVLVNHAGTVISPEELLASDETYKPIQDEIDFLGEDMTLTEFCQHYGVEARPPVQAPVDQPQMDDMTM